MTSLNNLLCFTICTVLITSNTCPTLKSVQDKKSSYTKNFTAIESINTFISTATDSTLKEDYEKLFDASPIKDSGDYASTLKSTLGDFDPKKLDDFKTKVAEELKKQKSSKVIFETLESILQKANGDKVNGKDLKAIVDTLPEDDKKAFNDEIKLKFEEKEYKKEEVVEIVKNAVEKKSEGEEKGWFALWSWSFWGMIGVVFLVI